MYVIQLLLFLIPPGLNIEYPYTDNMYLPAMLGFGLAYGVTVILPDFGRQLARFWRRKRAGY